MAGRRAENIQLLAVSKTVPAARVFEAYCAGQRAFGENYAQEGVAKITDLASQVVKRHSSQAPSENMALSVGGLDPSSSRVVGEVASDALLEWHFIGPIQSNKTRAIATHFQWVHGIDREKLATRLNEARPSALPPLNVCIEINVSGERSKSGIAPGTEAALAEAIAQLPRLKLRGLMAIPEPTSDVAVQRRHFALLRDLKDKLVARGHALDTLSMGMSADFESAIMEGSTIVRIGTAIFGARPL